MTIVAGKSEWVALFMATINFVSYQNEIMAPDKKWLPWMQAVRDLVSHIR